MITIRKSNDRGHADYGWLDTRYTFSFARYVDRRFMGFRDLRVINEDVVAPGKGFGQHPHDNMEIITYVLSGALAHRDTLGHVKSLGPGEVQRMSAGTGIEHSEFNPSSTDPVHLLQIWLLPAKENTAPSYEQKSFPIADQRNRLHLVASPDGAEGSVRVGQDVRLYAGRLDTGHTAQVALAPSRHAWVQVVRGSVDLNGQPLEPGDGAAVSEEQAVSLRALENAEVLVFDLN